MEENLPIKILLAEDDEDDRELFQDVLSKANSDAKLATVENGNELMKYLAAADGEHPDIIFLDINMPVKNGKECLKEIRADNKYELVPIIMFSTSTYKEDIDETFASGANLYVSKWFFFHEHMKVFEKIFASNWREELLKPDKKQFVMHTPWLD